MKTRVKRSRGDLTALFRTVKLKSDSRGGTASSEVDGRVAWKSLAHKCDDENLSVRRSMVEAVNETIRRVASPVQTQQSPRFVVVTKWHTKPLEAVHVQSQGQMIPGRAFYSANSWVPSAEAIDAWQGAEFDINDYLLALNETYPTVDQPDDAAIGNDESEWTVEKNNLRCALVDKEIEGTISQSEKARLEKLQRELVAYRRKVAPLPIDELREIHAELLALSKSGEHQDA